MKIKYNGSQEIGIIDFITWGIVEEGETIKPGKIYEIPDDDIPEYLKVAIKINPFLEILSEENPLSKVIASNKETVKKTKKNNKKSKKKDKKE